MAGAASDGQGLVVLCDLQVALLGPADLSEEAATAVVALAEEELRDFANALQQRIRNGEFPMVRVTIT